LGPNAQLSAGCREVPVPGTAWSSCAGGDNSGDDTRSGGVLSGDESPDLAADRFERRAVEGVVDAPAGVSPP
jgi:hypothetical protein